MPQWLELSITLCFQESEKKLDIVLLEIGTLKKRGFGTCLLGRYPRVARVWFYLEFNLTNKNCRNMKINRHGFVVSLILTTWSSESIKSILNSSHPSLFTGPWRRVTTLPVCVIHWEHTCKLCLVFSKLNVFTEI